MRRMNDVMPDRISKAIITAALCWFVGYIAMGRVGNTVLAGACRLINNTGA